MTADRKQRRPFLLVHGSYHGGWCWRRVSEVLSGTGAQALCPTLTGLGERAHLLSRDVGFGTHVQDIVAVLVWEDLRDVILVGHSYGAAVVHAVADRVPERINRVVYLDSQNFDVIQHGPNDVPGPTGEPILVGAEQVPCYPVPDTPTLWGVTDVDDLAWLRPRLTPQPVRTRFDRREISNPIPNGVLRTFVACLRKGDGTRWGPRPTSSRVRDDPNFDYRELDCPHDVMVTHPDLVADLLLSLD
jgi:pimeloyl-ACP methyl ester carboxylesterase